jgi:fibronectin type 3 domain-containing protein
MKIDALTVTAPGTGYTSAPVVTIVGGGGNGATASATLTINAAAVTVQGNGYTSAPTVNFTAAPAGGTKPVATATVVGGKVTAITITTPGTGYTASPLISLTGGGGTGARATSSGGIGAVKLLAPDPAFPITAGGGGYTDLSRLTVTFTGGSGTGAAVAGTGKVFDITLTHPGFGYAVGEVPTISVSSSPSAATATAEADRAGGGAALSSHLIKTKTIQELFDPTYGRLNATFGVELPFTSALTQTTIPLGYVDEVTEKFADGETQIWKITHNGVDTHPVHFHLLNVQLINRVGWDGLISAPLPQEMGWKETIKLSPLEDSIVAVRAKKPTLPGFGLPLSVRAADPSQPLGSPFGFTQIDPATGTPKTVVNDIVNYGWEYTWHCHILGHEENDFMRPVIFNANEAVPLAPGLNVAELQSGGAAALLQFTDNSATEYKFSVRRADVDTATGLKTSAFSEVGTQLANGRDFVDATIAPNASYAYKVAAIGAAGEAESNELMLNTSTVVPTDPTLFKAVALSDKQVALSWTDTASNEVGYLLERSLDNATTWSALGVVKSIPNTTQIYNLPANSQAYPDAGYTADTHIDYRLTAVNAIGQSAPALAAVDTLAALPLTSLAATVVSDTQLTLNWVPTAPLKPNQVATSYTVTRTGGAGPAVTTSVAHPATTFADSGLAQNTLYTYSVAAVNASGATPVTGTASTAQATTQFTLPSAITALAGVANAATQVTLTWQGGTPAQSYTISRTGGAGPVSFTAAAPTGTYVDLTTAGGTAYTYTVTAVNGAQSVTSSPVTVTTPAQINAPTINNASVNTTRIQIAFTDNSNNETRFVVQRSVNGGAFVQIATITGGNGTGNVSTLNNSTTAPVGFTIAAGNTYAYRVIAQRTTGTGAALVVTAQSLPSGTVTVVYQAAAAPSNLAVARVQRNTAAGTTSTDRVDLNWTAPTVVANQPALSSYTVEWSRTANFATIAGSLVTGTTLPVSVNVARGTAAVPNPAAYYFRVRSTNAVGTSTPSTVLGPVNTL